jgi:hypothetical protein
MNTLKAPKLKTSKIISLKILNSKPTFQAEALLYGPLPMRNTSDMKKFKFITGSLLGKKLVQQEEVKALVLNLISNLWDTYDLDKTLAQVSDIIPLIDWKDSEWAASNCLDILLGHLLQNASLQDCERLKELVLSRTLSASTPRKRQFRVLFAKYRMMELDRLSKNDGLHEIDIAVELAKARRDIETLSLSHTVRDHYFLLALAHLDKSEFEGTWRLFYSLFYGGYIPHSNVFIEMAQCNSRYRNSVAFEANMKLFDNMYNSGAPLNQFVIINLLQSLPKSQYSNNSLGISEK